MTGEEYRQSLRERKPLRVYLNGEKIELCEKLQAGDTIEIGDSEIKFACEEEDTEIEI